MSANCFFRFSQFEGFMKKRDTIKHFLLEFESLVVFVFESLSWMYSRRIYFKKLLFWQILQFWYLSDGCYW